MGVPRGALQDRRIDAMIISLCFNVDNHIGTNRLADSRCPLSKISSRKVPRSRPGYQLTKKFRVLHEAISKILLNNGVLAY